MSNYVLSEIAEIFDCEHKTAPTVENSQYRSIRTTDIANGKIHIDKANRVSEDTYFEWSKRAIPEPGDIILAREAPVGEVGWIGEGYKVCLGQRTVLLKVTHNEVSKKFLLYFLANPDTRYNLQSRSTGSVVAHLNVKDIRGFSVSLPPFSEQKTIAYVLSSLDDKIDLLHRQNKTLEAMAETLFRQWFVEEAQEDWEGGKVGDLFVLQRGFDLPTQNRTKGIYPIYAASGYSGGHIESKVKAPGVTTGRSGLLGKVFFVMDDFWPLNTSLYIKEFRVGTPLFSYFFLKGLDLESFNAGSAVPTLNRNHVHEESTMIPPQKLIRDFEKTALPFYLKIRKNEIQLKTLKTLRDTLLPKLMSGEVRVDYTPG